MPKLMKKKKKKKNDFCYNQKIFSTSKINLIIFTIPLIVSIHFNKIKAYKIFIILKIKL